MNRSIVRVVAVLALLGIAALAVLLVKRGNPSAATTVVVDASIRHQTIDGWPTNLRHWEEDKRNDRYDRTADLYLDTLYRYVADSIGINAVRLEIPSGMENPTNRWARFRAGTMGYKEWQTTRFEKVNDNADPNVVDTTGFLFDAFDFRVESMLLPLKRAVEARGETLHVNVNYVDFKWNATNVQGPLSHAQSPEEFAEFVLVYFNRLRDKYGIIPDAFEVILEPENTEGWRGPTIGRALVAATDRLAKNRFTPEIIAPSNTSMENAIEYFDSMIEVPGVLERLDNFAYHRYGPERVADVKAIRARAVEHKLKTSMLEKVDAGIDVLLEDLTVGHVSAWQQWATAGRTTNADNGGYYARVDLTDSLNPKLGMARLTAQLSQVFLFVRRGAVRVESTSDNPDKRSAAFVHPDGRAVLVVRARKAGSPLTVQGLPAGTYGQRFVSDARRRQELPAATVSAGGTLTTTIPEPGVLTIYATGVRPPTSVR